jgi:hypothetical protein
MSVKAGQVQSGIWCAAVLIRNTGRLKPSCGLILDWNLEGRRWEAWPATPPSAPRGVFHRGRAPLCTGFDRDPVAGSPIWAI